MTGYLAWGAWVSAADRPWLTQTQAWWRVCLRPGNFAAPLVFAALWLVALLCYWYPRRLMPQAVGITTVVTMVLIGGVLTTASLAPCRGGQTPGAVAGWVLDLYVGNPPSFPLGACTTPPALAYQLGGPVCLAATLTGALTVAAVLWRQPVDRMRARMVRDATILTGLDTMTLPLLQRLAQTFRPASIVVIEPDATHPLLDEARATGARVMIGQPSSPRVLLPVIAGNRGCALRRLYALRGDVAENEAVLAAARTVLRRYQPDPDRQPHLVARIDDPRHADHWRGWHIGRSSRWFQDALSAHESTASSLLDQVFRTGEGSCCCAGTAPWPWPSSGNWPGGPGSGRNSPKPRAGPTAKLPPCRSSTCCCWTSGPRTCAASTSRPRRRPWCARCVTCGPNRGPGWTGCSPCWTRCRRRPRPGPPWSWRIR